MSTWKQVGYLSKSRSGANAVVMIRTTEGEKKYYVANLKEVVDVLTGKQAYTKLYAKK